jgi:hypothetical protein
MLCASDPVAGCASTKASLPRRPMGAHPETDINTYLDKQRSRFTTKCLCLNRSLLDPFACLRPESMLPTGFDLELPQHASRDFLSRDDDATYLAVALKPTHDGRQDIPGRIADWFAWARNQRRMGRRSRRATSTSGSGATCAPRAYAFPLLFLLSLRFRCWPCATTPRRRSPTRILQRQRRPRGRRR